ncbi:hypothetical protein NXC24_PB00378 (plasmid) [Rhizobium sp. NXC24]|nr:hypothetical protein NXC24_PB00378 [Rhizobium sp. NXC24]
MLSDRACDDRRDRRVLPQSPARPGGVDRVTVAAAPEIGGTAISMAKRLFLMGQGGRISAPFHRRWADEIWSHAANEHFVQHLSAQSSYRVPLLFRSHR